MDDFPKEFPRVWFVAGIWLAAILLVATMLLYTSTRAHAQGMVCEPKRGSWSLVRVVGPIGCIIGSGTGGTPIETGKGV